MSDAQINKLSAQQAEANKLLREMAKQQKRQSKQQQEQLKVLHNWGKQVEAWGKQVAYLGGEVTGAINHMREVTERLTLLQKQVDRVEHNSGLHPAVCADDGSEA